MSEEDKATDIPDTNNNDKHDNERHMSTTPIADIEEVPKTFTEHIEQHFNEI